MKVLQINQQENPTQYESIYHNLSLGLTTKANAYKGCGQE
jgi:hypothetical protein